MILLRQLFLHVSIGLIIEPYVLSPVVTTMKGPLLILTLSPHDMFNMPLNFLIPTKLWFSPNTSHPLNQPQYEYWTVSIYWAVKTLQFIPSFSFCMFFFLHIEKDELVQWYIDIIRWLHVAKHAKPNITNLNIRYPEVYFP